MIAIINRFFITWDVEEVVTKQFIAKLGLLDTTWADPEYKEKMCQNFSLMLEALQLANRCHFGCLTAKCLDYFDSHSTQLLAYFEKKPKHSPELLLQIMERNTFGVPEIKIFSLVKKLIQKNGLEIMRPLLKAIRFSQFMNEDLSEVYASNILKGANGVVLLNHIKSSFKSSSRVCTEKERFFETKDIDRQKATLSRCLSFRLVQYSWVTEDDLDVIHKNTVRLSMPTMINHIVFELNKLPNHYYKLWYFFRIVITGSDGQKTKLRWFLSHLIDVNEYFFDAKPVDQIDIYCNKDIVIRSMKYRLTENIIESKFLCEVHEYGLEKHRCVLNT